MNPNANRRTIWVLLAILAVFLTALPGIFAWPAERILFNPAYYKQALSAENAYSQFPQLVGEMIAEGGNVFLFGSGSRMLQVLQGSNYQAVVQQVFPADWVHIQADSLVDQFWAYFNFQVDQFHLQVDFRPVKARLDGGDSSQIASSIVRGFPPCQGNEILVFGQQLLNGTVDRLPLCKPPQELEGIADLFVQGILKSAAAAMPDQLDLASALRLPAVVGGQPVSSAWAGWFAVYRFARRAGPWLPLVALVLLAAAGLLALRTVQGPFYWLGLALLLPGAAALIIALLLWLLVSQLVPLVIARLFGANVVAFDLLTGMLSRVFSRFLLVSGMIALFALILGGIFLAAAFLLPRKMELPEA